MKYVVGALIAFGILFSTLAAQTSIGLRIGPYYGLTIKHNYKSDRAVEGIFMTRRGGASFTGLYEAQTPIFGVERLNAFAGIGAHVNVFRYRNRAYWDWDREDDVPIRSDDHLAIGVDMILGISYSITKLPLEISIDWKPALNLIGDHGLSVDQYALSMRFIL
ncbi:MAG: hypothetical protein AAFV07_02240 [Bacteroidota bacterium]